jgi:hypothetical protein
VIYFVIYSMKALLSWLRCLCGVRGTIVVLICCCATHVTAADSCVYPSWRTRLSQGLSPSCTQCDESVSPLACACLPGYRQIESSDVTSTVTCVACSTGSHSSSPGSAACSLCPANTYSSHDMATNCTQCPTYSHSSVGSSQCTCRGGFVMEVDKADGSLKCTPCEGGTYADTAAGKCVRCGANQYSSALSSSCSQCPSGSTSSPGSYRCTCGVDYYTVNGINPSSMRCARCPAGTSTNNEVGATACQCPGGTRQLGVGENTKCYRCTDGKRSASGDTLCASKCLGNTYDAPDIAVVKEAPLTGVCKPCPQYSKAVSKYIGPPIADAAAGGNLDNFTINICECQEGFTKIYSSAEGQANDLMSRMQCLSAVDYAALKEKVQNKSWFQDIVQGRHLHGGAMTALTLVIGYFIIRGIFG